MISAKGRNRHTTTKRQAFLIAIVGSTVRSIRLSSSLIVPILKSGIFVQVSLHLNCTLNPDLDYYGNNIRLDI